MSRSFILAVLIAVFAAGHTGADDPPFHLGQRTGDDLPVLTDVEMGTQRQQALLQAIGGDPYGHRDGDFGRAGCPMNVRRFAIPSNTRYYGGYQVGGGAALGGEGPTLEEGVFGWDYFGILFTKRIALNWSHGARYQGGTGAYRTDGPRPQRH